MSGGTPREQREALAALIPLLPGGIYLVGGVAVSAHVHHRQSRDLDLFVADEDLRDVPESLSGLPEVVITSRGDGVVHLTYAGIPATVLRYDYPLLVPARPADGLPVPVADPLDLACMKLSAITGRGARRDFWDLYALLSREDAPPLAELLAAFSRKYAAQDVGQVIKSLVYFGDAEVEPMTAGLDPVLWDAIKSNLVARVREL